jgi:hypothetical protein
MTTPQPQAPAEGVLTLDQALRRAFILGQTYWQQADSDSYSQNRKSDETRQKFETLVSSMLSTPAGQPAQEPDERDPAMDALSDLLEISEGIGRAREANDIAATLALRQWRRKAYKRVASAIGFVVIDGPDAFAESDAAQQRLDAEIDAAGGLEDWRALAQSAEAPAPAQEPDMRAICEALGFDPTNHHNAAKCPYCRLEQPAQEPTVTEEMVTAYLQANYAYWKRMDELPTPPDKWRTGTSREATRVSLEAALAIPQPVQDLVQRIRDLEHTVALQRVALAKMAGEREEIPPEPGAKPADGPR